MDLDGLGDNFWRQFLSMFLFYALLKAITLFDELTVTPPTAHIWTMDLKMSSLIHAYLMKDWSSNHTEWELVPVTGDQGGSSAGLHLSD